MPDDPPPPHRPRGPGDAWVELPDGRRFWGRFGAAGLLAVDADGAVLLQHRVGWSHFGGTWGLPGGARQPEETELAAAVREAVEETGVDAALLAPRFAVRLDLPDAAAPAWSYTTVAASAAGRPAVAVSDLESTALAWTPQAEVDSRDLHPGFAAAWPRLRALLPGRAVLVVDVANVVGSRPDGWWRDRRGATEGLLERLAVLAVRGLPVEGDPHPLPVVTRWPEVVAVVEGEARGAAAPAGLAVVEAPASGDDAIVAAVSDRQGATIEVVTADRELADRCRAAGATVLGPSWLLGLL